jgi:hypothetical protein
MKNRCAIAKLALTVLAVSGFISCQGPVAVVGTTSVSATNNSRDLATFFFDRAFWGTGPAGVTTGLQLDANEKVIPLDFNHDGLTDLFAWNMVNHRQCLYKNNGSGLMVKVRDEVGSESGGITPGFWEDSNEDVYPLDYNNDGFTDMLVRNRVAHTSAIFLASTSGNGQFQSLGKNSGANIVPDFWFDSNEVIIPLDYNGDGRTDLLIYNVVTHNQGLYDFSNQPSPGVIDQNPVRVRWYQNANGADIGFTPGFWLDSNEVVIPFDYNGDGKSDLIVYNKVNHNQGLYKGNGDGSFSQVRFITSATGTNSLVPGFWLDQNEEVIPGYLNNDGLQDLIVRNKVSHTHALYYSNGVNSFSQRIIDSGANVTTGFWWDSNEILIPGNFYNKGANVNRTDLFIHNMVNFNQGLYKNIISE